MMFILTLLVIMLALVLVVPIQRAIDPVVKATYEGELLTLYHKSGKQEKYWGECTVWQTDPDMYDVGLFEESRLYRYWSLCQRSTDNTWEGVG